jgi:hypothetical protein
MYAPQKKSKNKITYNPKLACWHILLIFIVRGIFFPALVGYGDSVPNDKFCL